LTAARDPRVVLREAGLRPKKSFGQNFLVATPIALAIAEACVPEGERGKARVVERGAGTGVLTRFLAERARSVVAIERDRDLAPILVRELGDARVQTLEADAASVDFAACLGPADPGSPRVLCGNLPYAITGQLLRKTVDASGSIERAVFMVQDEVARRLAAAPGSKERGALSVFVQAAFDVRRLSRVPPGAFHPPPAVTSAVVELVPLRPPRARESAAFRAVVKGAFQARRKTLRNAWRALVQSMAGLEDAARRANVDLDARGETLEVEAFARMATELGSVFVLPALSNEGPDGGDRASG
jgi:16S rRNA (adenine1518-N6/adenine1519-N6)-dimethyltransferase